MSTNNNSDDHNKVTQVNPREDGDDGIRVALDKILSVLSDEHNMQQVKLHQAST